MKAVSALALTAAYAVLLLVFYVVHVWYFPVQVVFYSAMMDAALAAAVMTGVVFGIGHRRLPLGGFERILLVVIWLLGGYGFAISVPTVLDRSLSFYILEKLQQRGGGIQESRIADVFTQEYLPEFRLVDVRLTEQLESGTITIENGCVKLTEWGRTLATISGYFRNHFLPKERLLAGEYTDALVDPFKNSKTGQMGYECE